MSTSKTVIEFQQITCIRCGALRIRAVPCPECSARPDAREVNDPVQQRRRLLDNIRSALNGGADSPIEIACLEELASACDETVQRLKSAAGLLGGPTGSAGPLHDALVYFGRVRAGIRSIQPHRQQIALAQTATRVLLHLDGFVNAFLEALTASTPLAAEVAQQRGLADQDRAIAAIVDMARRVELANSIDFTTPSSMVRSLFDLLRSGEKDGDRWLFCADERVSKLLGSAGDIVVGLPFVVGELIAELEGTGADFARAFGDAYAAIAMDLPALARVAAEDGFVADFRDGQISASNAYWSYRSACENAISDRQLVEAILDIHVRQVEGSGAVLARVLLLTSGLRTTTYRRLVRGNATEDIRAARKDPHLAPLLDGLSEHLRTARSHSNIRFQRDSIEATASGVTLTYSHAELIDLVLRANNSILAGSLALRQALSDADVQVDDLSDIAEFGLSAAELASIAMTALAQTQVVVDVDGDLLQMTAVGQLGVRMSAVAAGACVSVKGPTRFEFTHEYRGTARRLTGPTSAFTVDDANHPRTELDELAATMRSAMCLRLNGEPVVSLAVLRNFCSSSAAKILAALIDGSDRVLEAARQIMVLRDLAQLANDAELEGALRLCSRWIAQQDSPIPMLDRLGLMVTNKSFELP